MLWLARPLTFNWPWGEGPRVRCACAFRMHWQCSIHTYLIEHMVNKLLTASDLKRIQMKHVATLFMVTVQTSDNCRCSTASDARLAHTRTYRTLIRQVNLGSCMHGRTAGSKEGLH